MSKKAGEKNKYQKKPIKIMVFGTFDGVHKGHLNFFEQARALNRVPKLIVSIARDKNVFKIKRKQPKFDEKKRMQLIKKTKLADKVVLSGAKDHIPHIVKESPNIIALGYDQRDYIKNLKRDLKNKGLNVKIVRLKPYQEKIFKNTFLNKN